MKKLLEYWKQFREWYSKLDTRVKIMIWSFIASSLLSPWFVVGYVTYYIDDMYQKNNKVMPKDVWVVTGSALIGMILGGVLNCMFYHR